MQFSWCPTEESSDSVNGDIFKSTRLLLYCHRMRILVISRLAAAARHPEVDLQG